MASTVDRPVPILVLEPSRELRFKGYVNTVLTNTTRTLHIIFREYMTGEQRIVATGKVCHVPGNKKRIVAVQ